MSNTPQIRFAGFTDAWEQRKVGELTVESSEYTTLEAGFPLLTSSRNGLMYQNEYRGKQTTDSTETMFSIVPLGACTYRHMSDDDVFHLNVNRLEKGLVSREYPVFYASDDNNLDFIVQQINSSAEFRSFCAEQKKGGTRTRLYYKNLCEFQMLIPNTEEQEKIATFLLTLDTLITLHQRECFSFDFSGESAKTAQKTISWEQRKLSDLFEERNEQAPMDEEYPLMAFIANIGVAPKGDRYDRSALVHDEKGKKYKRTEKGDFIYSSNNLETGSIGLNNYGNACISPVYSIFKSKHTVDPEFMGRILLRKEFINQMVSFRQGVVYGQWKIHEDDFLNLDILVPQTTEQQKIGGFFSELDKIITLHQHKPNKKDTTL